MILSEEAARMHVKVSSRNEQIHMEVRGRYDVEIRILGGYAERAGEQELEQQLGWTARVLFAHRSAAYQRVRDEVLTPSRSAPPETEAQLAYRRDYETLGVSASSTDGSVTISTVGLETFTFEIARGTVERRGGAHVAAAATEAANRLIPEVVARIRELRRAHFVPERDPAPTVQIIRR